MTWPQKPKLATVDEGPVDVELRWHWPTSSTLATLFKHLASLGTSCDALSSSFEPSVSGAGNAAPSDAVTKPCAGLQDSLQISRAIECRVFGRETFAKYGKRG